MNPEMPPPIQSEIAPIPPMPEQTASPVSVEETPLVNSKELNSSIGLEANPIGNEVKTMRLPTESMNYYERLNILPNASQEEIVRAYRVAARDYHPDTNLGDPRAEEAFKLVQEAFENLSNNSSIGPGQNNSFSNSEISKTQNVERKMPQGTSEALLQLREAWTKYGRLPLDEEYFKSLETEYPNNLRLKQKVIEKLPELDKAWDSFIEESGINFSVPKNYDYFIRSGATSFLQLEIRKVNILRELNSLLKARNTDSLQERQNQLQYFLDNWSNTKGDTGSLQGAVREARR